MITSPHLKMIPFFLVFFALPAICQAFGSAERIVAPHPSPYSMDFYGYIGEARPGDRITIIDPDGVLCGEFLVKREGQYGFVHVYGDDPGTPEDEGARRGDELVFQLNGIPLSPVGGRPVRWLADRQKLQVDFTR